MEVEEGIVSFDLEEVIHPMHGKDVDVHDWVRVSLVGIEFLDIETKIFVAAIEIYVKYAEAIGLTAKAA